MGMVLKGIQQRKDMMNSRGALCLCVCAEWNGEGRARAGSSSIRTCLPGHVMVEEMEQGRPVRGKLELLLNSPRLCEGLEVGVKGDIHDNKLLLLAQIAAPMCQRS